MFRFSAQTTRNMFSELKMILSHNRNIAIFLFTFFAPSCFLYHAIMPLIIGSYKLKSRFLLAPMAGITDRLYRDLCRSFGAGLATSEMISSDLSLLNTRKTQSRLLHKSEAQPRCVQILGTEPKVMAEAARFNESIGADIIDINMGCPAKKVCRKAAGSALMQDPELVRKILTEVVNAVNIPVTVKIRTGTSATQRNALSIAKIAEDCGISALAVHGRTRKQAYKGFAEFESIRRIKQQSNIPVIANGDISNTHDAKFVLNYTRADGLMLGRITLGQPWIFQELINGLANKKEKQVLSNKDIKCIIIEHIKNIHTFNPGNKPLDQSRIARKYIDWYLYRLIGQETSLLNKYRQEVFSITEAKQQLQTLENILDEIFI